MSGESFKSKAWMATIVAIFSLIGTLLGNFIDIWVGYKKAVQQTIVERQDNEVRICLKEIESLIESYNQFKFEVNIILKNFCKSNMINLEDFYSPQLNRKNFHLKDEELKEKVEDLSKRITPSLQNTYNRLTTIHKIPIPEDIITTINGINLIIVFWYDLKGSSPVKFSPFSHFYPMWCPYENLYIPPLNPEEADKLQSVCIKRLNEQIATLTDIRKRILNGEF